MKKTHAGRKHLWRTSTALPYIATALMLCLMSACQRSQQAESRMQASAHLDSLARTCLSGRFDNPEETTRRLERLENQQKDTASRFHVELYKAVVLNEMNKKRECNEIRNKVLQWCKAHPGDNYLSGMVWNHLGVELVGAGRIHESCKYFEKACHMLDGRIVNQSLVNAYINAANANLHIGRPSQRYNTTAAPFSWPTLSTWTTSSLPSIAAWGRSIPCSKTTPKHAPASTWQNFASTSNRPWSADSIS